MKKLFVMALCLTAWNAIAGAPHLRLLLPNPCSFTYVAEKNPAPDILLEVFPNPASESITLDVTSKNMLGVFTVQLYNVMGLPVWQEKYFAPSYQWRKSLDLSRFGPGIYFLSIRRGQDVNTVKIVIKP